MNLSLRRLVFATVILSFAIAAQRSATAASHTMAKVKTAGALTCGLNREEPEYSNLDAHGNRALFDVDLCKAVAVAVLGPGARFNIVAYSDEADSLKALASGAVDLLATASPTMTNQAEGGFRFGPVMLYDYQALMVNTAMGVHSARDLQGKKICYLTETDIELRLNAWMAREHIHFLPFPFQEEGEMEAAYLTDNCAAITADATQLAYERIAFRAKGRDYQILPDVLEQDPLASATRGDDPEWSSIVQWVDAALIQAEAAQVTKANAQAMRSSASDPAVLRLLGATPGIGRPLGLDDGWVLRTVQAVGNYGEIFDRDLGPATPMRLPRGANRLPSDGGLLMPLPMR